LFFIFVVIISASTRRTDRNTEYNKQENKYKNVPIHYYFKQRKKVEEINYLVAVLLVVLCSRDADEVVELFVEFVCGENNS
jgi:spore germination protein GerM